MAISGELRDADWTVAIETAAADGGGYRCRVRLTLTAPEGACERTFAPGRTYATEHEAAVEGLRAGMTWIEMKKANTFTI
ncbi:hypothetical protein [Burkholderia multivorans]|uniref:UDP-glucose 4-epimerase n=1 Tax=Burkholderia multivorans TaxID=87883 RepID=A0ABD7LAD8_9BURK|nr:hypothetical protein [Burkholderia multivorans]MBR7891124.1 hypothetical protein [Burkholderia multivorans]MBR8240096.1 hypothetical protein [Burkholderia multivorans]MBR8449909.1 hypothetical protein [Burkholderia multivorans]MBU9131432.1 hypothetical protein [Burkholderia multivorans]MBU9160106.1 hypothetical protein [Burkholderia multivorans]